MRDLVYVSTTFGFFGLAALFLAGCSHIVGADDPSLGREGHGEDAEGAERGGAVAVTR